jgi:hypothetical protein
MTVLERIAAVLERLADAEEQATLAQIPASPPQTAPAERQLAPWDNAPMPMTPPLQANQPYQVADSFPPLPRMAWTCPVHHGSRVVPAGVSKRTGNTYEAFLACAEPGCDEKPPRARR